MKNLVTLICLLIVFGFRQQAAEAKPRHVAKRCVFVPMKWIGIAIASPGLLVSSVGVIGEAFCDEADRVEKVKAELDDLLKQMQGIEPLLEKSTEEQEAKQEQNHLIYEAEEKKLE